MITVSASKINDRLGCPRKRAYRRTKPLPSNKYAVFGTRGHGHCEQWLLHSTPPDATTPEGQAAMAGLAHLPMPGTAAVELAFRQEFWGVTYTGRIDFLYGYDPGRVVVVGDHKFTGDMKYMKRADGMTRDGYDAEKDLRIDPQWIVYGHWAATTFAVKYVVGQWQYYRKKPPYSEPVIIVEHRDVLAEKFALMHAYVVLPLLADEEKPPEELERNLLHCGAFGGCPYKEECWVTHPPVSPLELAAAAMSRAK